MVLCAVWWLCGVWCVAFSEMKKEAGLCRAARIEDGRPRPRVCHASKREVRWRVKTTEGGGIPLHRCMAVVIGRGVYQ